MNHLSRFIARLTQGTALVLALCAHPAFAADTYTKTQYPIVLVHGLLGFSSAFGVDYFYGIQSELERSGARVFVAQVSPTNSNEVRGEQLLTQVQQILALTGASKVNLIGHSQGAPTSRYVASVRPDLVASVTSVGGVNDGSAVADVVRGIAPPGTVSEAAAAAAAKALVTLIALGSDGSALPQNGPAALDALTTAGSRAFNARYPEGLPTSKCGAGPTVASNGVHYFSWSGAGQLTNLLDVTDPVLAATSLAFGGAANDGMVSTCSSHLGYVIKDNYLQNHLDEVNQTLGLVSLFETSPVTLFRQQANRLKNAGL